MAQPYDSATYLSDVSALLQEQYFAEFTDETPQRFGSVTNKYFKPYEERIDGDGKTMQVQQGSSDGVRFSTNALSPFATPNAFTANELKVRFSQNVPASSDFSKVSASAQVSLIDIENGKGGAIIDFTEKVYNDIMPEFDEKLAIHRHLPRSAQLGVVSGAPRQNNVFNFEQASTSTITNTTGARIVVSSSSISYFRPGTTLDFYNGSTLVAGNIRVTDSNPVDNSVGLSFNSTVGNPSLYSTGLLVSIASGNTIFFNGERNQGMYSLGAYFTSPATSGDSFIGGVDRNNSLYRWLIPTTTRVGATSAVLTKSMIDDLAVAMNFRMEEQIGVVITSNPTLHQKLRNEYTEAAFLNIPDGDNRLKRFANFGAMGLNYQHPTFGLVKVMSDVLHPDNQVRVIVPETWRTLYYGHKGLKFAPGQGGMGFWYRVTETTPNTGQSLIVKCDAWALACDWCNKPWKNGAITNVTAA